MLNEKDKLIQELITELNLMSSNFKKSYKSLIFTSFDDMVDYMDNLGDDDILIKEVGGSCPVTFLRKEIDKDEYKRVGSLFPKNTNQLLRYDLKSFYKEKTDRPFGPIMFRAKSRKQYTLDIDCFKGLRVAPISLRALDLINESDKTRKVLQEMYLDGSVLLEWGDLYISGGCGIKSFAGSIIATSLTGPSGNQFNAYRKFKKAGMCFGGGKDYYKFGMTYYWRFDG